MEKGREKPLMDAAHEQQGRGYWRDVLFYVTFLYFTVGFLPYVSLSSTYMGSAMAAAIPPMADPPPIEVPLIMPPMRSGMVFVR